MTMTTELSNKVNEEFKKINGLEYSPLYKRKWRFLGFIGKEDVSAHRLSNWLMENLSKYGANGKFSYFIFDEGNREVVRFNHDSGEYAISKDVSLDKREQIIKLILGL